MALAGLSESFTAGRPLGSLRGQLLRWLILPLVALSAENVAGLVGRLRAAAQVVGRHLVDLALRDLDVEAVHLVVLHAQVANAGAGAFARFEVEQEGVAVLADRAQLVDGHVVDAVLQVAAGGRGVLRVR